MRLAVSRIEQAVSSTAYRAGTFAPASTWNIVLFDLSLLYNVVRAHPAVAADAEVLLDAACRYAAKRVQTEQQHDTLSLARAARRIEETQMRPAESLLHLAVVIERNLLGRFPRYTPLTPSQQALRHDLALVLALEAEVVRASLRATLGDPIDLGRMVDDREQHLYLFCARHGSLNDTELGLVEESEGPALPDVPLPKDWLKRLVDVLGAGLILLLLMPLIAAIAFAMRRDQGPLFYAQPRVGRDGRVFRFWKFRTMVPDADRLLEQILASDAGRRAEYETFSKLRDDPRVTPIGGFLRRTSLDELPQLYNVLVGDMSLVGPRPIYVEERDRWGPYFRLYKRLRPGLTGPWQLYFRSDRPYDDQFECMVDYARDWSFWRDLRFLLETVAVPFRQKGAY